MTTYCDICAAHPGYPGDGLRLYPACKRLEVQCGGDIGMVARRVEVHARERAMRNPSPPERALWEFYADKLHLHRSPLDLHPQFKVGRYRIDFADPGRMLAIEVDGLAWHNGQASFIKDQRRQRDLQAQGWTVVRFAAKEALDDPGACLREVARLVPTGTGTQA